VLSNVLLTTDNGRVKLVGTNLELAATCWIGAKVAEEGSITVPAKLLGDVVAGLPDDMIDLTVNETTETLQLRCGQATINIKGIAAEEFPAIPALTDQGSAVSFSAATLREAIEQVVVAAADDDTRPVLAGVLIRLQHAQATFTASNGFRLSIRTVRFSEPIREPYEVIVPARALQELGRIIGETEGNVLMSATPSGAQILFQVDQTELVSRLIDGRYPNIERIIPRSAGTRAVLNTDQLEQSVKLASYFATSAANVLKVAIKPGGEAKPGTVTLSANAAEVGDNQDVIEGLIQGEQGEVLLNAKYVADVLRVITTSQFALEIQPVQAPAVFKPVGQEDFIHIIMPMNVR
jgi:DNA polymerase-3 subunit beta